MHFCCISDILPVCSDICAKKQSHVYQAHCPLNGSSLDSAPEHALLATSLHFHVYMFWRGNKEPTTRDRQADQEVTSQACLEQLKNS